MKSFIMGKPMNYAIKNKNNNYNLHLLENIGVILPNIYIPNSKLITPTFIYYYSSREVTNLISLECVNNVDLEYLVSCNLQFFNKIFFKKTIPTNTLKIENNKFKYDKSFIQFTYDSYDQILVHINNNTLHRLSEIIKLK